MFHALFDGTNLREPTGAATAPASSMSAEAATITMRSRTVCRARVSSASRSQRQEPRQDVALFGGGAGPLKDVVAVAAEPLLDPGRAREPVGVGGRGQGRDRLAGARVPAGLARITFRAPHAMTVTAVRASLKTAQSSGSLFTVDINESGSSVLSTPITIDNGEKTSTTADAPPVISDSSIADDAEITIDIDTVGSGGVGPVVTIIGVRP